MSARVQYGNLMREAGRQILAATLLLEDRPLPGEEEARSSVAAYVDLLHALSRHGRELFGGERNMWAARAALNPDPRDAVAAKLVDHLAHVGQRNLGHEPVGDLAASWQEAARAVRAGTDLLATFHETQGGWRTPDASVLEDPSVRAAGFGELSTVTIPVARAATCLGRRLEELGFAAEEIDEIVPETVHVREVALQMRELANLSGLGRPLSALEVARPEVRGDDPCLELGDRVVRLHRTAWQLTKEDWVGVMSLADLAVAGIAVYEAAAHQTRMASSGNPEGPADLSSRRALSRFERGAQAWRDVHAQLRQLRTATPVVESLRNDVVAVRELLETLAETPSRRAHVAAVSAAGRFGEVAAWNVQTFEAQGKKGRVYIPGRFLTGEQVSDEPRLVRAKIKGTLAPLQKEQAKALTSAYEGAIAAAAAAAGTPPPVLELCRRMGPER